MATKRVKKTYPQGHTILRDSARIVEIELTNVVIEIPASWLPILHSYAKARGLSYNAYIKSIIATHVRAEKQIYDAMRRHDKIKKRVEEFDNEKRKGRKPATIKTVTVKRNPPK